MKNLNKKLIPLVLLVLAGIIYFIADYFMDLPPTELEFRSETVKAVCMESSFRIEGEYVFQSPHPRRKSYHIGFPVAEQDVHLMPENIQAIAGGKAIPFRIHSQGISFDLPVESGKETILKISYTLPAPDKKGIYITKTANLWPKSVRRAEFIIPAGVRSNYHKPEELSIVFEKFRPKENWKIEWE